MKNKNLFHILLYMSSLLLMISCDKAEILGTSNNQNGKIDIRTDDCEDCPIDDCCCAFDLDDPSATVTFQLCNTTNGIGLCTGGSVGNCSPANNGGQHFTLSPSNLKEAFCVNKSDAFWIKNTHMTNPATINLTCQHDRTSPQTIQISIPANTAYYFATSNSCVVSSCQ